MEDKGEALRELLLGMGLKRMFTAWTNGTVGWRAYGKPITSVDQLGRLTLRYPPDTPASVVENAWFTSNSVTVRDGSTYQLTVAKQTIMNYKYFSFWEKDDPVFEEATRLYTEILNHQPHEGDQKIKWLISDSHHLSDNVCPCERGTASMMESYVDAAWLLHHFIPPDPQTLDEEALMKDRVSFGKRYPMGKKYQ